jgi:serine phosphatase RsbU (regulator of sigma subunit)
MHSPPPVSPAADPPSFREQTLARLMEHVRALIPVGAATFATLDERRGTIKHWARWLADPALRAPFDGLLEALRGHDRSLIVLRIDAWEAPPGPFTAVSGPLGAASLIACPLRAETGQVLGVLVVASLDPARPLRSSDLAAMEVVADLAAMALGRAAPLEDGDRPAREEQRLERAVEQVWASLELEEVYRRVAEHATEVTGATQALLTRLNARSGELLTVASVHSPGPAEPWLTLESRSFRRIARTRHPLLDAPGRRSVMHAPIELGPRLYGVLSVAHEQPGRFGEDQLDRLARLAVSSAAAIANAIDYDRERRIARALTLGFVPEPLPALPGYESGLFYAPALGEPTGGDVYGAWMRPGGDSAVLVGDVAGKGVENAALSAMVRFFVEARSWDTRSPAAVLEQANSMLIGRLPPDTFVTAFYAVLSPGSLCWAGAGHLPPLHVSGRSVSALGPNGLPLGVDPSPGYDERKLDLAPGDLVFAFTDGLVEARRGPKMYGDRRLARLVATLARTTGPEELVRAVHDEIAHWSGGLTDDAVALALRRRR